MCNDTSSGATGVTSAADANAALAKDALAYYKAQSAAQAPAAAATAATDNAVASNNLAGQNFATSQAQDLATYGRSTFRPIEQKIASDAMSYDTPERRQQAAGAAMADVQSNLDNSAGIAERNASRSGATMSSGRQQQLAQTEAIQGAIAKAGAADTAVRNVEATGASRMADAATLGQKVAANQATQQGLATTAGQGAVSATGAGLAATQVPVTTMANGYGTALNANQSSGNLFNQTAQIAAQSNAADTAGLVDLGKLAGGLYQTYTSSKAKKTGKRATNDEAALDAVTGLKNEGWSYKDPADDVSAGGQGATHIGPYAEDTQRAMGDSVAPGGKMINVAAMGEQNRGAIRALTSQLEALEQQLAKLEGPRK